MHRGRWLGPGITIMSQIPSHMAITNQTQGTHWETSSVIRTYDYTLQLTTTTSSVIRSYDYTLQLTTTTELGPESSSIHSKWAWKKNELRWRWSCTFTTIFPKNG